MCTWTVLLYLSDVCTDQLLRGGILSQTPRCTPHRRYAIITHVSVADTVDFSYYRLDGRVSLVRLESLVRRSDDSLPAWKVSKQVPREG